MNLKQSRTTSSVESLLNTFSGLGLSLAFQWIVLVVIKGLPMTVGDNIEFALIMTAVSFLRGLAWRRIFEARRVSFKLSPFLLAVIAERQRQVDVEGYDARHDDDHAPGELARCGAAYLYAGSFTDPDQRLRLPAAWRLPASDYGAQILRALWVWSWEYWKPRPDDRRRDLVRGCALGLAEGERMERNRRRHDDVAPGPRPIGTSAATTLEPHDNRRGA